MLTIEEIKDQVAKKHGYSSWIDMVNEIKPQIYFLLKVEDYIDECIQEYAKQTAIAQREACYKSVKGVNYNPVSEHIFDSILNTPLVTD